VLPALLLASLPQLLGMEEALRLFRERGFDLLIAEATLRSARADERAAHAVANPVLNVSAGKSFDYQPDQTAFSAGLTDPNALSDLLEGKRGLRIDVAQAALRAAKQTREDALRTLSLTLEQAMLDAALASAQADVARQVAESSLKTQQLDEKRLAAGAISEAELARIEVASLEARQAQEVAEQQAVGARHQIAFLLGETSEDFAIDPGVLSQKLPPDPLSQDVQNRPDILAAQAQIERAQASLSLAKRQRAPDVSLSAQYTQQGSGQSALQPPTLTLGLQLPLPIFYRQQGEIEKAEADLRTQEISLAKTRAQALLEVRNARAAVEASRKLVLRMQGRLLERATRARDLVQVQYEKGAASLLDLLDAQRTWAQTNLEYLKDLHDFWLATFQLEAATGKT
jgi:cobalt-zinc-cadmium efflux system outer membrane protein